LNTAGEDTITADGVSNIILSDFGVIDQKPGVNRAFDTSLGAVVSVSSVRDDDGQIDTITTQGGADWILAGVGSDIINAGDGENVVIADHGAMITDGNGNLLIAKTDSVNPQLGGDDKITTGDGTDWVLGGSGLDVVTDGFGLAVILGDNGIVTADQDQKLVSIVSRDEAYGGRDIIASGNGASYIFGGNGKDDITSGSGDDVILGDFGSLTFIGGVRADLNGPINDPSYGDDDVIATGAGDDWTIGGVGSDLFTNLAGLTIMIGDAGRIQGDSTGLFTRAESLQNATGSDDTMFGGVDRDVMIGGAGPDFLDGNGGNDLIIGDGGLLHRVVSPAGVTEVTFESTDIELGGDDTLIGDEGRDIMFGGIGNDKFDLDFKDDIAAGEFARVRFEVSPDGSELITSFLTPAVRDLDIIVQIVLGLNGASKSTTLNEVQATEVVGLGFPVPALTIDMLQRLDALLLNHGFIGSDASSAVQEDEWPAPGLFGYELLSQPNLLSRLPVINTLISEPEQTPEDPDVPQQDGANMSQGSQAPPIEGLSWTAPRSATAIHYYDEVIASANARASASASGWQMAGWRIHSGG
jgi:Ca2+-binding RTX toxin-like protein